MDDVLQSHPGLPSRRFDVGEHLLVEGAPGRAMYVLVSGTVEVRRGGELVTTVSDPGSFLGEIAALLDAPYGADVVARTPTDVLVVEDASASLAASPELTLAVARLLAHRLRAVTSYLGDIKRQYGGADGHLALMDQVLSELTSLQPSRPVAPGSERGDVPHQ